MSIYLLIANFSQNHLGYIFFQSMIQISWIEIIRTFPDVVLTICEIVLHPPATAEGSWRNVQTTWRGQRQNQDPLSCHIQISILFFPCPPRRALKRRVLSKTALPGGIVIPRSGPRRWIKRWQISLCRSPSQVNPMQ